jgi:hypothetical protein
MEGYCIICNVVSEYFVFCGDEFLLQIVKISLYCRSEVVTQNSYVLPLNSFLSSVTLVISSFHRGVNRVYVVWEFHAA